MPHDPMTAASLLEAGWLREEMISACERFRTYPYLTNAQRAKINAALVAIRTTDALRARAQKDP